jgi:hypothetical protein
MQRVMQKKSRGALIRCLLIAAFLLSFYFLIPLASADTVSYTPINPNIPGSKNPSDPVDLVVGTYRFALMGAGLLAFGSILWGSIKYTTAGGNTATQGDARDQITQAFLGLGLLLGGYLILNTINPAIVSPSLFNLQGSLPGGVSAPPTGRLPGVGQWEQGPGGRGWFRGPGGRGSGRNPSNCSVAVLSVACSDWDPVRMSRVCLCESAGGIVDVPSGVDVCRGDGKSVSWGLMQINISANPIGGLDCPSAFSSRYSSSNKDCRVTNPTLYNDCVRAASNPALNLQTACQIFRSQGYGAWGCK